MTFIDENANLKQFHFLKFANENCEDEHIMSKISIVLRRDKIEAPYYMVVNVKLSTCIDRPERGLIHAMDMLNHTRRHNLSEEAYGEIESLLNDKSSDLAKISEGDLKTGIVLMSRNAEEFNGLLKDYGELFNKIDNMV